MTVKGRMSIFESGLSPCLLVYLFHENTLSLSRFESNKYPQSPSAKNPSALLYLGPAHYIPSIPISRSQPPLLPSTPVSHGPPATAYSSSLPLQNIPYPLLPSGPEPKGQGQSNPTHTRSSPAARSVTLDLCFHTELVDCVDIVCCYNGRETDACWDSALESG